MADAARDIVLELRSLSKRYGRTLALDGLSLTIERGEVFGLLGPNGAGKTTTIRLILGLVRPDAGGVVVMGQPVGKGAWQVMRHVGALVEGPTAYSYLSGRDNLRLAAKLAGDGASRNVDGLLALVGLAGKQDVKVGAYSLGMKQRLGLALALVGDPSLLILDEPTNGLDPRGIREVRRLITRLAREKQLTILLSSHLLHEVQQTCDRVAIIDRGRLVLCGRVPELLNEEKADNLEELFIQLTGGEDDEGD
ncbi:MAG: ABC transporter ATP-binding protein [Anaerolineae bacterium]|nr:ABC transporter ATP-binding protein [Anaerolineae bacterium]